MTIRIGTSGWSYAHWDGVLYEPGLPPARRLGVYAGEFDTVELNASFYRWPRESAFASWNRRLPEGFQLSVKAARGLTHARKLYQPEPWLERFERCFHELGRARGMLLLQTPPALARDDARLRYLVERLPSWLRTAVEFRHASWHCEDVFALLAEHGVAYCVMSGAGLPCVLRATAREVYVRLHGPDHHGLYAGSYTDEELRWWADRIREWSRAGHDVYVYFNNDGGGHAVRNARTLRWLLGV